MIYPPTGEPLRKAYAITLICNGLRQREPDWIVSSVEKWAGQDFDEALFGERMSDELETDTGHTSEARQDVSDALQCCAERLIFTTDDGYIGLGPSTTKKDDVLAVLLGSPSALVIRPNLDTSALQVVGECFVYGLHDATPLLGALPEPWKGIAAWVHGDRRVLRFVNTETKEKTAEDPRLGPLAIRLGAVR